MFQCFIVVNGCLPLRGCPAGLRVIVIAIVVASWCVFELMFDICLMFRVIIHLYVIY